LDNQTAAGWQPISTAHLLRMHIPLTELTPSELRNFILHLEETHNASGMHCAYRAVKTFLLRYEEEFEPEGWHNPIREVKPTKVPLEVLEPIPAPEIDLPIKG
jgi:hypothetical protein